MNPAAAALQPSLIRQIHALKKPSSIDLSLGEPTLPIDPELWQRGLARYERSPKGYTPNLGLPELRERIAASVGASASEILVATGSQEALFVCFFTLLAPGDEVVVMDPSYPAYASLARMCGAVPVSVPLRAPDYSLCTEDVRAALTPRTRLVVVSSPSNPLGRCDREDELRQLAALAEAHGFTIVSDEIYRELTFAAPPPRLRDARTITVSGLSKSCAMTGHRLGWLVAPPELVQKMWPVHQLTVSCAPTLAQHLAIEAFSEPRFLSAHRSIYAERARAAQRALAALPHIAPEGGLYVMAEVVPAGEDAFVFCKRLLAEKDVVCVPGTAFGANAGRFVRLTFAGDQATFAEGAARLSAFSL
jgi:aspartate/methionine/tyrosine aminotransferase